MRLLAVFHKYAPIHNAGAEWMAHAILRRLVEHGHEATVVFPGAPTYELDGVLVTATPARHLDELARQVDVIVTHLDNTREAVSAARHSGRPIVHLVHNDRQLQFHAIAPGADVLIVPNSEWIAATISPKYRAVICRPPVFVADYELELERPRDAITLVNLTDAKGSGTFYELARELRDRSFLGVTGAYGVQDRRKAGRLRNVELLENTPNIVDDVYRRTRVLLMPSAYESWGRVAIEAGAGRIPVIAHPTPGLRESLGPAGIFADRRKVNLWRAELERLDDAGYYRERAEAAHARAVELEAITDADLERLEAAIAELVEEHRPRHNPPYHGGGMILDTVRAGLRCPVCGAKGCSCKPDAAAIRRGFTVVNAPKKARGPHPVYRTWSGDFRYQDAHAIRYGLLPSTDLDTAGELPRPVEQRLTTAGVDDLELERVRDAYRRAAYEGRAAFLTAVALLAPKRLLDGLPAVLEALETAPGYEAPPAPAEPSSGSEARVGDVLDYVGTDPVRITEALETERAGRARKTLITELERRLGGTAEHVAP